MPRIPASLPVSLPVSLLASLLASGLTLAAAPALAQSPVVPAITSAALALPLDNDVAGAPMTHALSTRERAMPAVLTPRQRYQYRRIFLNIRENNLTAARNLLASGAGGPLDSVAEGQILLKSGRNVSQATLLAWLKANPRSPEAPALTDLARSIGASDIPPLVKPRQLTPIRLVPRTGPQSVTPQGAFESSFAQQAAALVKAEKPLDVEALLRQNGADLSPALRSEWAEKAAWIAYLNLDDETALRLAGVAASGEGEWATMGDWVAGLAHFRRNSWAAAAQAFDNIGKARSVANNLRAAGAYWAARAHIRAGQPQLAPERLKAAVARDHTGFYGILAAKALGINENFNWTEPDFIQADWTTLKHEAGARRAAALVEVGELDLADRELRYLAATAPSTLYEAILRLAARLNLPATQYWLASNPPAGILPPMSAQLPTPDWRPFNGWRVDRDLVFAHALQESRFITTARSGPGAKGAMQLMPGTARDLARAENMAHREDLLSDPAFNVEYGQSYLEGLRDDPITGGRLPLVIAGYNAGPGAVKRWNEGGIRYNGDPLLYLESIPYWETRHYVKVVLRNYWLYQMKDAATGLEKLGTSLKELAENRWPTFPKRPEDAEKGN